MIHNYMVLQLILKTRPKRPVSEYPEIAKYCHLCDNFCNRDSNTWVERFNVPGSRLKSPWPRPGLHGHQNHLGMSRQGRPNWLLAKGWRVNKESSPFKVDGLVKSRKTPLSVIPAKAGIQSIQIVKKALDSGFHRSDDFLRDHQL